MKIEETDAYGGFQQLLEEETSGSRNADRRMPFGREEMSTKKLYAIRR